MDPIDSAVYKSYPLFVSACLQVQFHQPLREQYSTRKDGKREKQKDNLSRGQGGYFNKVKNYTAHSLLVHFSREIYPFEKSWCTNVQCALEKVDLVFFPENSYTHFLWKTPSQLYVKICLSQCASSSIAKKILGLRVPIYLNFCIITVQENET